MVTLASLPQAWLRQEEISPYTDQEALLFDLSEDIGQRFTLAEEEPGRGAEIQARLKEVREHGSSADDSPSGSLIWPSSIREKEKKSQEAKGLENAEGGWILPAVTSPEVVGAAGQHFPATDPFSLAQSQVFLSDLGEVVDVVEKNVLHLDRPLVDVAGKG